MRLFVGVELDEPIRQAVADVAGAVRARLHAAAPGFEARWIPPHNLHLTLAFIGEVADSDAAGFASALRAAAFREPAFDLEFAGCGVFPPGGAPRICWIGVRQGADRIVRLHAEVAGRLSPLGFEPERRPYRAHLTIARIKEPARGTARSVRDALAATPCECGISRVAAVTLFRSRLSPRGAAYEALLRVPLS